MTSTLKTPVLTGQWGQARRLIERAGLPSELTGCVVTLDAHRTVAATQTFADDSSRSFWLERRARDWTCTSPVRSAPGGASTRPGTTA